ncbi:MAG TPA: Gfo/Idh/MocA family oxidoreductase [Acidobacteriaceae bacterium]|nr:Gfo/Idh/MocA family oxidoreductase [Acidobacteriaceae bacterium]
MDELRIGIIGMGKMARLAMRVFMECHLTRVVAFSARRQEVVEQVSAEFSIPGYLDYRKMLERDDLDAIVIATPDNWHFEFAHAALESGRHIFVEKPFTTNVKEADILLRLAHQKNRKIQVAFNHRWLSSYNTAHSTISSGEIGVPIGGYARKNDTIVVSTKNIRWAGETTSAWLLSSHDIDLVRWFLGSEPLEARAYGRKEFLLARGVPTYDMIQAQVKFANGAFVTFESGWIYPNTFPTNVDSYIQLVGSAGTVLLDRKCESLEVSTEKSFSYPKNFLSADIFGRVRGAFPSCLEDFARAILADHTPKVSGFDGRQVTAALEAIHESLARDGETVRIKQPDDDILSWSNS